MRRTTHSQLTRGGRPRTSTDTPTITETAKPISMKASENGRPHSPMRPANAIARPTALTPTAHHLSLLVTAALDDRTLTHHIANASSASAFSTQSIATYRLRSGDAVDLVLDRAGQRTTARDEDRRVDPRVARVAGLESRRRSEVLVLELR